MIKKQILLKVSKFKLFRSINLFICTNIKFYVKILSANYK